MILLLAVIYIVFISLGLPDSLFGVAWPVVHQQFGVQESFASVFNIIVAVCTGGVSFVSGKLIRKFGTGTVTLVSIVITALGLVGISFSPNIWVMLIFSVILGYGAGAIDTGLNNFVSLHFKAQHMNWLHCFWGVGVTLSPIIMSVFLVNGGSSWRGGYRVIALMQAAIALVVLLTLKSWKKLEGGNESQESEDSPSDAKFLTLLKGKGVATSILSLGLYCSMEFLIGTWGATYAVNVFALPPEKAAKWVSLYYGGIMLGRMIAGFVSMKVRDKDMIRGGILLCLIGMIVFALPIGDASLFGLLLIGAGFGPIFPSVLHSIPERFGSTYSPDLTGYHMGGAYGIGFSMQLLYGYIASATTFKITPFVLLLLCAGLFLANEYTLKAVKNKALY